MIKTIINTSITTGALLINYFLIPIPIHTDTDRFLPALIILGIASIAGTVLCRKLRYCLIPDVLHILLLWAAVYFDINRNPYNLGYFFGWSPSILVWELAAVLLYMIVIQAATYGMIRLIKVIKIRKNQTHTEKSDEIG